MPRSTALLTSSLILAFLLLSFRSSASTTLPPNAAESASRINSFAGIPSTPLPVSTQEAREVLGVEAGERRRGGPVSR